MKVTADLLRKMGVQNVIVLADDGEPLNGSLIKTRVLKYKTMQEMRSADWFKGSVVISENFEDDSEQFVVKLFDFTFLSGGGPKGQDAYLNGYYGYSGC